MSVPGWVETYTLKIEFSIQVEETVIKISDHVELGLNDYS